MRLQYNSPDELRTAFENTETKETFGLLVNYFEGVGVLVKENLVDIRLVAELMTYPTVRFWWKTSDIIGEFRVLLGHPRWLSETEYLYIDLMKFIVEHPEFILPEQT